MDALRALAHRRAGRAKNVENLIDEVGSELCEDTAAGGAIVQVPAASPSCAPHPKTVGRHHALNWPERSLADQPPRRRGGLRVSAHLRHANLAPACAGVAHV